jgi:hypothetical protein
MRPPFATKFFRRGFFVNASSLRWYDALPLSYAAVLSAPPTAGIEPAAFIVDVSVAIATGEIVARENWLR